MDIRELQYQIENSFAKCPQCQAVIDEWPDSDPDAMHPSKIEYFPRTATFSGMCPLGHLVEFYLAEVKAGEVTPHDVTERVLGEFTAQKDCKHPKTFPMTLTDGMAVPTEDGPIEGPMEVSMCAYCGRRRKAEVKTSGPKFGLIGLDGRPIKRRPNQS